MRLTLTTPAATLETAKRASQALDADVGGYLAFQIQDEQGNYTYSVELPEGYPEQIQALMASGTLLHNFITEQFAQRFPSDPVPTLEQCNELCSKLVIS